MSATILSLPATHQRDAEQRLGRELLKARYDWMLLNHRKWETVATDGVDYPKPGVAMLMAVLEEKWDGGAFKRTDDQMRKEISAMREVIVKRNRIKAWLDARGADLSEIHTAEHALRYMFEIMEEQS